MSTQLMTVEQVITLIRQLSPRDQLRIVAQVLPELERAMPTVPQPRK